MIYLLEPNKDKDGHFHLYLNSLKKIDQTIHLSMDINIECSNPIMKLFKIYKALKVQLLAVPKGNVVHILYSDIYYKIPFLISGILRRNLTIVTMHSCPNGVIKHFLIKNFCKRVNAVIVHSDFIKAKMESFGLKNVYLVHYPSFYDYKTIGNKEQIRSIFKIPNDKIVISALGGTREDKGADILLRAFKYIPKDIRNKIIINIAGKPIDFDERFLSALARKFDINVRFDLRILSDKEFMENVVVSDYMVFPYRKHMTANSGPMTEAMVNRIPCIVPAATNLSDIADKYDVGISFEQENEKSLADTIIEIVDKPLNLKYKIADELLVDKFIDSHRYIYNEVINKNL